MARFKRLTDAEARTLTRSEILDRVEAEQQYWIRKHRRGMTEEDVTAEREFNRIMYAYLDPMAGLDALRDTLEGRRSDYWESRPGEESAPPRGDITLEGGLVMDEGQQAALRYGLREAAKMDARERDS
jgi:hypothetical protein